MRKLVSALAIILGPHPLVDLVRAAKGSPPRVFTDAGPDDRRTAVPPRTRSMSTKGQVLHTLGAARARLPNWKRALAAFSSA